jgi:hypothetical protein
VIVADVASMGVLSNASLRPLRVANAWLGATVGRYSFGAELLHLLLHAGLSRRFPCLALV